MSLDTLHTDDSEKSTIAPPNNLGAEAAVLGAILFDNNAYQRVADILQDSDFYAPAHQELYAVCEQMIRQGRVADGVTLREHFEKADKLSTIGGAAYLVDLLDSAAFGPEILDYAKMIRDLATRRQLIGVGAGIQSKAMDPEPGEDGSAQIEKAANANPRRDAGWSPA